VETTLTGAKPVKRAIGARDFTEWVTPHLPAMRRLALRMSGASDREDVIQESLAAAWRKWSSYDATRGTPPSWLLAIVADQARKLHRRRLPIPTRSPLDDAALADHPADIDLERAIATLAARQRLAVELYYFLGLPVAEVAATMNCSVGTVKATLSQARARLHDELGTEFR
jgi:RNA polymerase sigma factor (sigma-70 family)